MKNLSQESTILVALISGAVAKYAFGALTRLNRRKKLVKVGTVTQLNCYPIKSCRGITVESGLCTPLGLKIGKVTDRHWLVVRANGDFITQRQYSNMSLVRTEVKDSSLVIDAPGMPTLNVPLDMVPNRSQVIRCRVWEERLEGQDCGDDAAYWFSKFLGQENLRLLFSAPGLKRQDITNKKKPWGNPALPGDQAAFTDYCGYLITTEESLAAVNEKLSEPVKMNRFRPVIVIAGSPAFEEDKWSELQIGDSATFRMLDPCTRCLLITVNPEAGIRDPSGQPLEILKSMRCFPEYGTSPLFGVNATIDTPGVVRVGDPVYAILK